jgi:membrane-bound lytic murein transglycosylase D
MRFFPLISLLLITGTTLAQEGDIDSISTTAADEVLMLADTVTPNFTSLAYDVEYIPADDTPELIADRLSCLQGKIPLAYNDKVHAFINYFLIRDREHTRMVLRKKDLYFPLFEKQLKAYNIPDELKYLAIIESALQPKAVSRVRAVGTWQFMSPTARYFGLKMDWYIDERMDVEKSTIAACRYLQQLYNMFHDWELALAAYNTGPGNVRRAIRRSGNKKTFWEIYPFLPRETRAYVPQFVAMIYAVNYAGEHNLMPEGVEEPMRQDTLQVKTFLNLETFANLTGSCAEDLQKLNPSILHMALPGNGREHVINVPMSAKLALNRNRAAILDSASRDGKERIEKIAKGASGDTYGRELLLYRVKSGDALSVIAQRHRVRVEDIRRWNNLSGNMIRVGQQLRLWVLPSPKAKGGASAETTAGSLQYIVVAEFELHGISGEIEVSSNIAHSEVTFGVVVNLMSA